MPSPDRLGTFLFPEQIIQRQGIIQGDRFGAGVGVGEAGVGVMGYGQAEAGAVVEAVGNFELGAELDHVAQIQIIVAAPIQMRREAGGQHDAAAEKYVDQHAGADEAVARAGIGRRREGLEHPQLFRRTVFQAKLGALVLLPVEIEIAGADGQEIGIIGKRRRAAQTRQHRDTGNSGQDGQARRYDFG